MFNFKTLPMSFYESISNYYDHIFPLNLSHVKFIEASHSKKKCELDVLDVGCAVGDLSLELANGYRSVVGIDTDVEMIKIAKEKAKPVPNLNVHVGDMLHLKRSVMDDHFDIVNCFGNTLVHLENEEQVAAFFKGAFDVLKKDGRLLVQILNYDKIIDECIEQLPSIDNDEIRFDRAYNIHEGGGKVDFKTVLTVKQNDEKIENSIPLLALRKNRIEELLTEAGFVDVKFYGNFMRDDLDENSFPLVFEARKDIEYKVKFRGDVVPD